ncbi:MAG TPA: hypothetical protein VFS67_32610 [Polyangiaceae bacterium]|nr:hypothetical protein [Polyangiaceae bacterium]
MTQNQVTLNQPPVSAPTSYFRAALANQYNVILLAGSATFSAALASWAPLISGLVGEALWLVAGPRLGAFRRHTDAQREAELAARTPPSPSASALVPPEYAERAEAVQRALKRVEELCSSRGDFAPAERAELVRRLEGLLPGFAEVCNTHQRLRRAALQVPLAELQTEVASLHQALASETDLGVRASLRRGLTVAERRIRQLEGNEAASRSIELALQNFQQSLALLAEAAAGLSTAAELAAEIDGAASQLNRQAAVEAERELLTTRSSIMPPLPTSSTN